MLILKVFFILPFFPYLGQIVKVHDLFVLPIDSFFISLTQMPIREACHVAVQRNDPSKHRLWKHALARQQAKGQGPTPVLQIVRMSTLSVSC